MKRIFTAVDISEEARAKCASYIENLKSEFPNLRVGWEKPEKLHLTLKFFGDTNENQLRDLTEAVAGAAAQTSNFQLQISKTGAFPSNRNARILWLGVSAGTEDLLKLNEILESECEKRGFPKEKRDFRAHLTIARLREPHKSKELVGKHLSEDFETDEFTISEMAIYESRMQKSGSIYEKVRSSRFKFLGKNE